jgi:hypothetical protein
LVADPDDGDPERIAGERAGNGTVDDGIVDDMEADFGLRGAGTSAVGVREVPGGLRVFPHCGAKLMDTKSGISQRSTQQGMIQ